MMKFSKNVGGGRKTGIPYQRKTKSILSIAEYNAQN
jgi:hypothetical protein